MILVDISQICISAILSLSSKNMIIDENLIRHVCLNTLRASIKKFKSQYGEVVIACDNKNYWRREIFPYYKHGRKEKQQDSKFDWQIIFDSIHKLKDELREYFTYRVIEVAAAEADDVIGTLSHRFGSLNEKIMILSGDKDFGQLQIYENVKQYNPVLKKYIKVEDARDFLKLHIIYGDASDGIPNVFSDDDTFVSKKRQKSVTASRLTMFENNNSISDEVLRNFNRNMTLIDLRCIPQEIQSKINTQYNEFQPTNNREKIRKYMIEFKLLNLLDNLQDF